MTHSDLESSNYRYDGESVEIDGPVTAEQYVACYAAQGWGSDHPPYDAEKAGYEFDPESPSEARALRAHLRKHEIPHSTEVRHSWAPTRSRSDSARCAQGTGPDA